MSFSGKILSWYRYNKRSLPWRETTDPYKIWLSEIILQQTRVAQGTPYYLSFVKAFPSVQHLANAKEEDILKLWQGLGYYSRARNLHATAKIVVTDYHGEFPETYKELLKFKGIGDYTASAISSICFKEAQAVVDGNVYRVLARYFGIDIPINSAKGIKHFKSLAQEVMDAKQVRDYNQGIMEFGAIQCTPKNPYCLHCPLNQGCIALHKGLVDQLPVKINKTKIKNRYFNYLVPLYQDTNGNRFTRLQKRSGKGIWQNLWEFPLLESNGNLETNDVRKRFKKVLDSIDEVEISVFNEKPILHKLSHQTLHTKFWILETDHEIPNCMAFKNVAQYPVPVLIADFIKAFKF